MRLNEDFNANCIGGRAQDAERFQFHLDLRLLSDDLIFVVKVDVWDG